MSEPAWLDLARRELGVKEAAGAADNPRVLQYLAAGSSDPGLTSQDETPWCAGFIGWCLRGSGWGLAGSGSLVAKSYKAYGRDVSADPPVGAIAVFDRPPNPASGHVAFFLRFVNSAVVEVLGGNQSDAVTIQRYQRSQLIALRWPNSVPLPGEVLERAPSGGLSSPPPKAPPPPRREPPSQPPSGGAGGFIIMIFIIGFIAAMIASNGRLGKVLVDLFDKVF